MNIVFIINKMGVGGAERIVHTLAHHYVLERDFNVTIINLDEGERAYNFDSKIQIITLRSSRFAKGVGKLIFMPIIALDLALQLHRIKPNHAVSFLVRANLAHILTKVYFNRKPVHISERSIIQQIYSSETVADRVMLGLSRFLYPRADSVIAISEGVKQSLIRAGIHPRHCSVIYNPLDLDAIRSSLTNKVEWPLLGRKNILVTSGRFVESKDHATLLKAFAIVRKQYDASLVMIGTGPEEHRLKKLADKLGISEAVHWLGWQQNPYVFLSKCDMFVLTSRFEGFGNVILEAIACGLPVISTDCPTGPREILGANRFGILVPVGDIESLASAISKLITHPADAAELKAKAVQRLADFNVEKIAGQYLEHMDMVSLAR